MIKPGKLALAEGKAHSGEYSTSQHLLDGYLTNEYDEGIVGEMW